MSGLRHDTRKFLVNLHTVKGNPMTLIGIVVERAYVIFRITARNPCTVILQPYGRTFFSEVCAMREEAVTIALTRDVTHGKVQFR